MNIRQPEDNSSEIENDSSITEIDTGHYSSCCAITRPFRPLLNLGPIASGLKEAVDVGTGLWKLKNSLPIVITTSAAAFFSNIELTGETTRENFDFTCDMIKRRKFPKDWPVLSVKKEVAAICLTLIPALFAPFSEAVQTYYFVDTLPSGCGFETYIIKELWPILSGSTAFLVGMTVTLTDSTEMYRVVRERLAGQINPYKNTLSKIVSPLLGVPLGILDSLQKSAQSYMAIKTIFNAQSLAGKISIGIPSMVNAIPFFCFSGLYSIDALNDFFGTKKPFRPKKIFAFGLSLSIAVYLAFFKRYFNKDFYRDVSIDFGINPKNVPNQIYDTFSWIMFVQEMILITATLYSPMYIMMNRIGQGLNYMHGFFCSPKNKEGIPEEKKSLLLNEAVGDSIITIEPSPLQEDDVKAILQATETKVSTNADTLFAKVPTLTVTPETIEENKKTTDWCVLF